METMRTTEPLPPDAIATLLELKLAAGPRWVLGVTLVDRVIVPENPPKLARVTVDELEELRGMVSVTGFAVIEKSPVLLKTAV